MFILYIKQWLVKYKKTNNLNIGLYYYMIIENKKYFFLGDI